MKARNIIPVLAVLAAGNANAEERFSAGIEYNYIKIKTDEGNTAVHSWPLHLDYKVADEVKIGVKGSPVVANTSKGQLHTFDAGGYASFGSENSRLNLEYGYTDTDALTKAVDDEKRPAHFIHGDLKIKLSDNISALTSVSDRFTSENNRLNASVGPGFSNLLGENVRLDAGVAVDYKTIPSKRTAVSFNPGINYFGEKFRLQVASMLGETLGVDVTSCYSGDIFYFGANAGFSKEGREKHTKFGIGLGGRF